MAFLETGLKDSFIFEPQVYEDERGYFFESFNQVYWEKELNQQFTFIQDNQAKSTKNVLRGLHFQLGPYAQAKLVRVLKGAILDVIVDLRHSSPSYGKWIGVELSEENKRQLFVPRGFAHGYSVLSDTAEVFYKCDNVYHKDSEGGLLYNDVGLNIDWQIPLDQAIISEKDMNWKPWNQEEIIFP